MMSDKSPSRSNIQSKFGQKPYHSYTVLRAKFDQWLADQVMPQVG